MRSSSGGAPNRVLSLVGEARRVARKSLESGRIAAEATRTTRKSIAEGRWSRAGRKLVGKGDSTCAAIALPQHAPARRSLLTGACHVPQRGDRQQSARRILADHNSRCRGVRSHSGHVSWAPAAEARAARAGTSSTSTTSMAGCRSATPIRRRTACASSIQRRTQRRSARATWSSSSR